MYAFPQRPEGGIESPDAGVKGSWELPEVDAASEFHSSARGASV